MIPILIIAATAATTAAATALAAKVANASKTAIGWYSAGGALFGASGGYYYQEEISDGITYLFFSSRPLTSEQTKIIETDNNEIARRRQQPVDLANEIRGNSLSSVHDVLNQTSEQQQYLTSSVRQLNQSTINIDDTTQRLCRIKEALQMTANDADHNMQAMTVELNEIILLFQAHQQSISGTQKQLTETNNKLATTEQELAAVTQQFIQALETQKSIEDASKQHTETIRNTENNALHEQLSELSSKNESLTSMVDKLSHNLLKAMKENKMLRAEHKTHEKMKGLSESKSESSNEHAYNPSMFNTKKR